MPIETKLPKVGDPIEGTNLFYDEADIANLSNEVSKPATSPVLSISSNQGETAKLQADKTMADLTKPNIDKGNVETASKIYNDKGQLVDNPALKSEEKPVEWTEIGKDNVGNPMYFNNATGETKTAAELTIPKSTEQVKAETDLALAQKDVKALSDQMAQYGISDSDLKAQTDEITGIWNKRIQQMEDINSRRKGAVETLGTRLGSRWTGGKGGVFGGIISEEERQGVLRVGELESQKQESIQAAKSAAKKQNWDVYVAQLGLATKAEDKKFETVKELNKLALAKQEELNKELKRITNDTSIISLFKSGITNPSEILSMLNSAGGQFTFEEINKITKELTTEIKTPSGEYGEFLSLKADGEIPQDTKWFDYLAKKKAAEVAPKDLSGVISGDATRDADTIMSGVSPLKLGDLSTKDNYRAKVAAELNKKKEEALKSGDIIGIIRASAGGKDVADTFLQSFEKGVNVITQIGDLQSAIEGEATGPIWGTIRSANPYDVKAQTIKAQLSAIVPNLARGVYGEVGVLTDNDIKNYSKTLPTLQSVEEARNAILGITLKAVQRSLENKIKSQAGFGRDVSGIEAVYKEVRDLADKTLAPLQAVQTKDELDNLDLSTELSNTTPDNFWGKAQ